MNNKKTKISPMDVKFYNLLRKNVSNFLMSEATKYDKKNILLLDVAPQIHEGAETYFKKANVETLDIDKKSGATYIANLCNPNTKIIKNNHFDIIVCTEVLEHTLDPFAAVREIKRILKPGGIALVSTPFNFRIHGPLPDCWRFTIHGLKELFKEFRILKVNELTTKNRALMPVHYTLIVQKGKK